MDCSMCNCRRECTSGQYTGRCPDEPASVCFAEGKWWAWHGEAGPFDTKQDAINYEFTN